MAADVQPGSGAGREALKRGLVTLFEHRPAPFPGAVPDALWGGERPGSQGLSLAVGPARHHDLAAEAEVRLDRVTQRGVAGDVDQAGRAGGQRSDLVVAEDLIVGLQAGYEGDVAGGGEPGHRHAPPGQQVREPQGGLAGRAGHDDRLARLRPLRQVVIQGE
jgi:hypothetical protein